MPIICVQQSAYFSSKDNSLEGKASLLLWLSSLSRNISFVCCCRLYICRWKLVSNLRPKKNEHFFIGKTRKAKDDVKVSLVFCRNVCLINPVSPLRSLELPKSTRLKFWYAHLRLKVKRNFQATSWKKIEFSQNFQPEIRFGIEWEARKFLYSRRLLKMRTFLNGTTLSVLNYFLNLELCK